MTTDADLVAEAVGELLRDRCTQETVAAAEQSGWAPELWDALAAGGFPWISVDEDAGGAGGSVAEACAALEQAGRYAAPVPLAETGLLAGWLLSRAGLEVPTGPASTAPGKPITLRRNRSGHNRSDWIASGSVARVPWAREASRLALLGRAEGITVVVSIDPALARIEPGTNLAGEPRDTVHLDGVPIADADVAAAPTGVDRDALVRRGALSRAALIAGAAGRILDITVTYTGERVQFGRPVARFQAVGAHLVRLAEQTEAVRMAARVAAANSRAGGGPSFFDVAATKTVASEAAGVIAAAAHQATGAMGMTREYELGQLTRRLWSWREEYGGERWWSTRLGGALAEAGAAALWPTIAHGVRACASR
ncbi:acyl-CoA dehydrogenase family protein [Pseudonocardia acidicola]|uniref:Acyl-CoA/acyl-ACP dehydrogenase n=1 Tax=Pseudonocardia acidicola TaxID=2724939 RepID=A0ABX1SEE7_9PSEU|nr:acyl-CoA dehydrogenase family protein [Pseudonocardia acidicola]NMH99920.1 acyl-CoA/acyl-ACP dehydrogenase [Pseudonocardia acidicola]